jgi:hypothetical protein
MRRSNQCMGKSTDHSLPLIVLEAKPAEPWIDRDTTARELGMNDAGMAWG